MLPLTVVICICSGCIIGPIMKDWAQSGQFGDMFGMVNALFSGLAFAGVLISLAYQRAQMRQAERHVKEATQAAAFEMAYNLMNDKELDAAKDAIITETRDSVPWQINAGTICRAYQSLAAFSEVGYVSYDMVLVVYKEDIFRWWNFAASHVFEVRKMNPDYAKAFERLAAISEKELLPDVAHRIAVAAGRAVSFKRPEDQA